MPAYFELRNQSARGTDSLAADMMRHLHARQYLGTAAIVSTDPKTTLSAVRKQWLKLVRNIQKQRASTLNADKIIKYTHAIARMQQMHFTLRPSYEAPSSEVFVLTPDKISTMPPRALTVYLGISISPTEANHLIERLPADGLIVDYAHALNWPALGSLPKTVLEQHALEGWQQIVRLFEQYNIPLHGLSVPSYKNTEAMDDALDTLLGIRQAFLGHAQRFQRALELARPMSLSAEIRQEFDTFSLLAHRVQSLSPGIFNQHFLEIYNENDSLFLHDQHFLETTLSHDVIAIAITKHAIAGRPNLTAALEDYYLGHPFKRVEEF